MQPMGVHSGRQPPKSPLIILKMAKKVIGIPLGLVEKV